MKHIVKDVDYYTSLPYSINVRELSEEEGGGFFAYYAEMPGIMGDGETKAEAISDAKEAFKEYVLVSMKNQEKIPEPKGPSPKERINISIHTSALKLIDDYVSSMGEKMTRSEFLERAALHEMQCRP